MRARSNYLAFADFEKLLAYIPQLHLRKFYATDVKMLFKICYYCCLRIEEGLGLSVDDFWIEEKEVYLGKTKAGRNETASIHPIFIEELSQWLGGKKGKLFENMTYPIVYFWLKRTGKALDLAPLIASQEETGEKTVSHIFRKSFAKALYYGEIDGRKAPLSVISQKLRHKGKNALMQTWQYLKIGTEDVKEWEAGNEV